MTTLQTHRPLEPCRLFTHVRLADAWTLNESRASEREKNHPQCGRAIDERANLGNCDNDLMSLAKFYSQHLSRSRFILQLAIICLCAVGLENRAMRIQYHMPYQDLVLKIFPLKMINDFYGWWLLQFLIFSLDIEENPKSGLLGEQIPS